MSAKSFISARKMLTLTTDLILDPAASRTADKFARHCFCCQCTAGKGEEKKCRESPGRVQGGTVWTLMSPSIKFPEASAGIWPIVRGGWMGDADTGAINEPVGDDGLGIHSHCRWSVLSRYGTYFR